MVSRWQAKRGEQTQTCKPCDKSRKIAISMVGYNDRLASIQKKTTPCQHWAVDREQIKQQFSPPTSRLSGKIRDKNALYAFKRVWNKYKE